MLTSGGVQKMTKPPMEALLGARPEDILARKTAYNGELGSILTQPASSGLLDALFRARGTQDAALSFANAVPYGQLASTGGILAGMLAADPRRLP